ncbi:hypothetical protein L6164_006231 [Bauhinia variegata]|uniref:Uncharacterized protein n=1 Tax=Bauhinia variegata TaxID=167791 RepID=A0ACB9PVW3_BAUVA|nr:hypothetical protein L6164_006231 [Bauhinia variegata]
MSKTNQTQKLNLPWKTRLPVSLITYLSDAAAFRSNGTFNRRLLDIFDRKSRPNPDPVNDVKSVDVNVDPTRKLWFRIFVPTVTMSKSLPIIFFFHGGGFAFMSPASVIYDAVCRRFSRKIYAIVVSINYRLAPENPYPAAYDDGFDVLKYIDQNRNVLPEIANVSNCFLAGDSAGANLAHQMAVRACRERLRELKLVGLVSIQPFFGGVERTESETRLVGVPIISVDRTDWLWKAFLPEGSDRDHEVVNVSGPNAVDISGMDYPDTLVFVGGFDPLLDWQRRYYEWLRKSGTKAQLIEYPTMIHAFYLFPELTESAQLISQVKEFITKRSSF